MKRVNLTALQVRRLMDGSGELALHVRPTPFPSARNALWCPGDYTWPHRNAGVQTISNNPDGPRGWGDEADNLPLLPNSSYQVCEPYRGDRFDPWPVEYHADSVLAVPDTGGWRPPSRARSWAVRWHLNVESLRLARVDSLGSYYSLVEDTMRPPRCPWVWVVRASLTRRP